MQVSSEFKKYGRGGIRTHAIEMTGALNQRLRPLGHPTSWHSTCKVCIALSSLARHLSPMQCCIPLLSVSHSRPPSLPPTLSSSLPLFLLSTLSSFLSPSLPHFSPKLIVAVEDSEVPRLQALYDRGKENGVKDLRLLTGKSLREIEPHCKVGGWSGGRE